MLAACVVPFANARQASGTLARYIPITIFTSANTEAPTSAPEEDDEREGAAKERLGTLRNRLSEVVRPNSLPTHASRPLRFLTAHFPPRVPVDHFCNGLGSPYRC